MGLQITKVSSRYGMDLIYWKIGSIRIDWHENKCRVALLGFVNQAQRDDGKDPVALEAFSYNDGDFTFDHDTAIVDQIYAKIKADEDWSSATDVLE